MLTQRTQAAIAVLNDIYAGQGANRTDSFSLSEKERIALLTSLSLAGIIRLTIPDAPRQIPSYQPAKKAIDISLLNILEAIGEHIDCSRPFDEQFYIRYGKVAQKLGVINQLTRSYLQEIKLYDL